ncbi:MAG: ribosomal RNA small subunit methyltransferase A, partial [Erysipelotrichaceae bacterium]|nr:ribosomal RNA small subunit methyltransferase A [Erysipelotrichaceae bacterium]
MKNKLGEGFAKKKFGQNFLIDDNVVDKIARIACDPELSTIEIGPGLGALSEHLLEYSKDVTAYEIDRDMYNILQDEFKDEDRFRVILGDFLDVDLSVYENQRLNVASNLPYYVTTPILFKLFNSKIDFNKITVMVQKEVCERFVAKVNTEDYNSLSIIVQYLFEVKMEMSVKK